MALDKQTKLKLIGAAHSLRPIVMIGNKGLTENIITEVDRALFDHELVKMRIAESGDKAEKIALINNICNKVKAEFLRLIGNVAIIYRVSDKKNKTTEKTSKNK